MVPLLLNFIVVLFAYCCLYSFLPNQSKNCREYYALVAIFLLLKEYHRLLQMCVFCEEKEDFAKWYLWMKTT